MENISFEDSKNIWQDVVTYHKYKVEKVNVTIDGLVDYLIKFLFHFIKLLEENEKDEKFEQCKIIMEIINKEINDITTVCHNNKWLSDEDADWYRKELFTETKKSMDEQK